MDSIKYIAWVLVGTWALAPKPHFQFAPHQFVQVHEQANLVQVAEEDLKCMTDNIYYESATEPYAGKLAVATVVMNRVKNAGFPKTVCGVVLQRTKRTCQFSWVCEKRSPPKPHLYDVARKIAVEVLEANKRLTSLGNAMFFHNQTVYPTWASSMRRVQRIGGHTFYAPKGRSSNSS